MYIDIRGLDRGFLKIRSEILFFSLLFDVFKVNDDYKKWSVHFLDGTRNVKTLRYNIILIVDYF